MRHSLIPGLGVAITLSLPALAGPVPVWTVDKASSRVAFTGSMNGQTFGGAFRSWDASIAFDPKNLAASKVVAVVNVASIGTGDSTRDEALPSADWFSAAVFPRAVFTAQSFKDLGGGRYLAIGELSIRGVKRPLVLPFQLAVSGNVARMHGAVTIDRTWFGVGRGQWATGDAVATKVPLDITVTAHR